MINFKLGKSSTKIERIVSDIFEKHNMYMQIFKFDNTLWVRFSATVYNELSDYE